MSDARIISALETMSRGAQLSFALSDIPFDELLLTLHMARFTGLVSVGVMPNADRVFLREGAAVGVRPRPEVDRALLRDALLTLKLASAEATAAALDGAEDGLQLGMNLVSSGLVDADDLDRAVEEQARRRLFSIYELDQARVTVAQGIERLAHFHPVYVDVRPVIAFGMVVRSSPERKKAMMHKVRGQTVRLVAPYDEQRNGYGLPPPVLLALRDLANGIAMNGETVLPGLSAPETAGVLLLLDRMSLLRVD